MLQDEELFRRYGAVKHFLEFNWGRIGLRLQRVRKPADVSSAINLVPRFESFLLFREHNGRCFSDQGSGPVRFPEVRKTRRMHTEAKDATHDRWSEFHRASQKYQSARNSLNVAVEEFASLAPFFPIFNTLFAIAVRVENLKREFVNAQLALDQAQKYEEHLKKKRAAQEAWFAQNEIVRLRRSERRELNADQLAKAMAGMPEYGWYNSFLRCKKLDIKSFEPSLRLGPPPYPYEMFKMLTRIVKRMKPLKLERVRKRLVGELRLPENSIVRECVKPYWIHMQQVFDDLRGKRLTRQTVVYLLVGKFLDRIESGQNALEIELAPHASAELNVES